MEGIDFSSFGNVNREQLNQELAKLDRTEQRYLSELLEQMRKEILFPINDTRKEGIEVTSGRRYIRWGTTRELNKDLTPKFMEKIRENVRTSFYMKHNYSYILRNIEDGRLIPYYKNKGSPWFKTYAAANAWLKNREAERLDTDSVESPDTKWVLDSFYKMDVKVVLDHQPLMGTGPLPDWLRNLAHASRGKVMVALDTYRDNLCLWRCIAVYKGARPDRSTKAAQNLAESFYKLKNRSKEGAKTSLDELEKVETHLNKGKAVKDWQGIRVYIPELQNEEEIELGIETNVSNFAYCYG